MTQKTVESSHRVRVALERGYDRNEAQGEEQRMEGKILDGRYQVTRALSSGGFGQTFLAQDKRIPGERTCVVKQLKPQVNTAEHLTLAKGLFEREAQTLAQLGEHHDQIPNLLAYFSEGEEFYLVQDYVDGQTLEAELTESSPWSEAQVLAMLRDVLPVLAYVHQQGVIHRDIKPANIIRRRRDGKLVLIDFGAIKQVQMQTVDSGQPTATATRIGTVGYMASEQARGKPRPNSDLYALGMVAIQALTGRQPQFLEEDNNTGDILWRHLTEVSPGLAQVVNTMTHYHFKDRYPTAQEALNAIAYISAPVPPTVAIDPSVARPGGTYPGATPSGPSSGNPAAPSPLGNWGNAPAPTQAPYSQLSENSPNGPQYPQNYATPQGYGTPPHPLSAQETEALVGRYPQPGSNVGPHSGPNAAPNSGPNGQFATVPAAIAPPAPPRRRGKTGLIIGGLVVLAACGGGAAALWGSRNKVGFLSLSVSQPQPCKALVSGNARTAPTSRQNNVIREVVNQSVEVTGKQTPAGWLEAKLDGKAAWIHRDVIGNVAEMDRCLVGKKTVQMVEDLFEPAAAQPGNIAPRTAGSKGEPPAKSAPLTPPTDSDGNARKSLKGTSPSTEPGDKGKPADKDPKSDKGSTPAPVDSQFSCRCIPDAATSGGELRGDGTLIESSTDMSGQSCSAVGGRSGVYQCSAP
jgi:serine/threonine protein kinase